MKTTYKNPSTSTFAIKYDTSFSCGGVTVSPGDIFLGKTIADANSLSQRGTEDDLAGCEVWSESDINRYELSPAERNKGLKTSTINGLLAG